MPPGDAALLARWGFREPGRALRELPDGWAADPRWSVLLDALGEVADPDAALRRLGRLDEAVPAAVLERPAAARPLLHALGFSEHLADLLARVPGLPAELLSGEAAPRTDLRALKEAGLAHIAARDLSTPPDRDSFEDTGRALADLCDQCVSRALDQVSPPPGFAVMAMGKYGGRELNYSSDIDVLFVYASGDPDEHEHAARRVMQVMNGPPTIHRTDAGLRPQGKDGPLARSLDAYRAYYERWAQVWEFQALIKCRFACGDSDVGEAFTALFHPFVWPERLAPEAIEQVRALKARAEHAVERRGLSSRQLKLAPGGIRDVEFAVQLLQLVHGRHHAALRLPNTLAALDVLAADGFVGESDAAELAQAYVFLRHAEHRLQLVGGRQTHTLPTKPEAREHLARGMGYRDTPARSALDGFERDWRARSAVVRQIHEKLFYRPLLEAFATVPPIGPALGELEAGERLAALGFDRPGRAREAIVALTVGGSRPARAMRAILPGMLSWLAETPDPDAGLLRLRGLAAGLGARPHLLAVLRDSPPVAELVCRVLGTGPVFAELLERDPGVLSALEDVGPLAGRESFVGEAVAVVSRAADPEAALRRFKEVAWLTAASRDLAAGDEPESFAGVALELSHLADACLQAALDTARSEVALRTGGPPPGGFAIVGMGRLGGEELSYASDLDVMFVYEHDALCPDGSEARLYHSSVAERVRGLLGAVPPIFKVDADLRPEGRNGPIVRSLRSFEQYYERWASTWEFQALTRARHAAGDEAVTAQLLDGVAPTVYPTELAAGRVAEIRHMKARIERERVKEREDPRFQVKLGTGGLADVEFTVQLLQMRHGHAHRQIRTPNTLKGIGALGEAGLVSRTDTRWLRDAYLMLNRVRNHLYLLRGLPTDVIPMRDEELERLARSLGYGRLSRGRFLEDYRRITRRARQVCDRLFYGEE